MLTSPEDVTNLQQSRTPDRFWESLVFDGSNRNQGSRDDAGIGSDHIIDPACARSIQDFKTNTGLAKSLAYIR